MGKLDAGEAVNWYSESVDRRASMMREHGMIGRQYAGRVTQVISGSIGYDDWEWGVDLFAEDPLVFKKLIYEMRFDERRQGEVRGVRPVLYGSWYACAPRSWAPYLNARMLPQLETVTCRPWSESRGPAPR